MDAVRVAALVGVLLSGAAGRSIEAFRRLLDVCDHASGLAGVRPSDIGGVTGEDFGEALTAWGRGEGGEPVRVPAGWRDLGPER